MSLGNDSVFELYNERIKSDAYFRLFHPKVQYRAPEKPEPETTCACDCSLKMLAAGAVIGAICACLFTGMGAFDNV